MEQHVSDLLNHHQLTTSLTSFSVHFLSFPQHVLFLKTLSVHIARTSSTPQFLLPFPHCSTSKMPLSVDEKSSPTLTALSSDQPCCQSAKQQAPLGESSNPISIKTTKVFPVFIHRE